MIIPQIQPVVDLVALQNAVTLILLSDDRLSKVPVVPEFKLAMESDLMVDAIWTMPRSAFQVTGSLVVAGGGVTDAVQGPVGAGLLVEMPEAGTPSPNVTGPPTAWTVNVVAFEERNVNYLPGTGIFITSEQLCQIVRDILQLQNIYPFGQFKSSARYFGPAHDWMTLRPGIIANRYSMQATTGVQQTARSAVVGIAFPAGKLTLSCPDNAATILFTTDGSAPVKANPTASPYTGPVSVPSGTVVQTASWKAGLLLSAITGAVAP